MDTKKSIFLFLVITSSFQVQAITTSGRFTTSILTGLLGAGMSYNASCERNYDNPYINPFFDDMTLKPGYIKHAKHGGIGFLLGFFPTWWVTGYFTPSYRLQWVLDQHAKLEEHTLFHANLRHRDDIDVLAIQCGAECSNFPLVTMVNHLQGMNQTLDGMISNLEQAAKDEGLYSKLGRDIAEATLIVNKDRIRIRTAIQRIRMDDRWNNQFVSFQKDQEIKVMANPQVVYHAGLNYNI